MSSLDLLELNSITNNFSLTECPSGSGWKNGGKLGCYYAAREASTMSYASAKEYCKSLDKRAHLCEVLTKEIRQFVEDLEDMKSYIYWWLGGSDRLKV